MAGSTRGGAETRRHQTPVGSLDNSARYKLWKEHHVPLLYDWLSSRKLVWPHAAVEWGTLRKEESPTQRSAPKTYTTRALYLAERTGSDRDPNTLLQFDVRITQQLTTKPQEVAKTWQEEAAIGDHADQMSSRDFYCKKRIIHPGEVNRMRLVAPDVVVTHTDKKELYIWDFQRQPNRDMSDMKESVPDLTLVGHTDIADFAVDVAQDNSENPRPENAWVISGGRDFAVLLWRLSDAESTGKSLKPYIRMEGSGNGRQGRGHSAKVEDVRFNIKDRNCIASVSQDTSLLLWDVRNPSAPTNRVDKAHDGDVNGCDFSTLQEHLIVTAGNDHLVKVWDRRNLTGANGQGKPVHILRGHSGEVFNVMWNKNVPGVCASAGEDGHVLIWKLEDDQEPLSVPQSLYGKSRELMFRHIGHGMEQTKLVDFRWLPSETDPWCLASLSETYAEGGSVLQIWRISDLLYRPKEDVADDLRQFSRMT